MTRKSMRDAQELKTTNAELAVTLSERGIEVFPCREGERKIKSPYTTNGFTDASCDPDQVRRWWRKYPGALVGVVPGQKAVDALVLDLDVKDGEDGVAAFRQLVPNYKDYPFVGTPSGGEHIWCARPEGGAGNGEGALPKSINVRCDAGYVCFGELADGSRYESAEVVKTLLGDDPFPAMPVAVAKALKTTRKVRGGMKSTGKDYLAEGHVLLSYEEAQRAHKPLRIWSGNQGQDQGPSGQFASLAETAINALLETKGCALDELDAADACKTVHEIIVGFLNDADGESAELAAEHMERRGPYSIMKLIEKSEPDRASEDVKRERSVAKLGKMLAIHEDGEVEEKTAQTGKPKAAKQKVSDAPNWATDTHAAVKAALRELALSEAEHSEPVEFAKLLEQIGSKAASYGLDLHRKMPGKRVTLLEAELRAIKAAIKEEAKNERADRGIVFPHTDERDGLPRKDSVPNVGAWLEHYEHQIWFDEFADEVMHGNKPMDDSRMLALRKEMHENQFFAGTPLVKDGIHATAHEKRRHPVREYFDKVRNKWDDEKRLDTWLIDYCGAPNNKHWRMAGRLLLIAVVMRIRHPGAKWDNILALLGPEGFGKSKLCRALAIKDDWHLPGYQLSWDQKTTIENTAGIVIAEYEEMAGHSQKEQATLKAAASRAKDRARKAYGHFAETKKRTFVTIANANELEVLISKHGNRRFWPLHITNPIDVEGIEDVRDQLYGEAVHAQEAYFEKHGTDVELPEAHWAFFGELQEQHRVKSPVEDRASRLMDGFDEGHLLTCDLYTALEISSKDRYQASEAEHAMKLCGWSKERMRIGEDCNPQRYFIKGNSVGSRRIMCERNTVEGGFYLQYARDGTHDHGGKVVHLDMRARRKT